MVSNMANRVDTENMFKNMISPYNSSDSASQETVMDKLEPKASEAIIEKTAMKKQASSDSASRKTAMDKQEPEAKERVTVYLTKAQMKELRLQDAAKVKEADRSALIRAGLDIVLSICDETYLRLKQQAEAEDVSLGEIVKRIVERDS